MFAAGKSFLAVACPPHRTVGVPLLEPCSLVTLVLGLGSPTGENSHVRVHQWRRRDSQFHYYCTMLLFQIMTELSPIVLIVSTVSFLHGPQCYTRGALECFHHCSRQTAKQSKKNPLKTRHHTQTSQ